MTVSSDRVKERERECTNGIFIPAELGNWESRPEESEEPDVAPLRKGKSRYCLTESTSREETKLRELRANFPEREI